MTLLSPTLLSRRHVLAVAAAAILAPAAVQAADNPREIRIDWATYNPVSMVLKDKGFLEKEFAQDGISIRWVQTLGSNKALEFLNAGSIDFGSTAGSAALLAKINGNPIKSIYVFSRPEWTALVTRKDTTINTIADLKGKRVAVTRGTDPHIFLVRALLSAGLSEKDITPVLLQHPDGKTALIRGDVDAWAGLDPMMAQAEIEDGARLFHYPPTRTPTPGASSTPARNSSRTIPTSCAACWRSTRRRANIRSRITATRRRPSSQPPSCPTRWSTSSSRSAPRSRSAGSARLSATRSSPPGPRSSRPA